MSLLVLDKSGIVRNLYLQFYVNDYTKAGIEAKFEEILVTCKPKEAHSEEEIRVLMKQDFTSDA
ncbi:hypothetical protein T01_15093 [Trichinella spiralis]|uniref:Uncharacterized protein n=1 Tax=Trichinella spiralis TaxID=6334 RepID=A0A0V1BTL8_TRISP|nr:hypothetical protein T01_15093 [Trichinella spiralis]